MMELTKDEKIDIFRSIIKDDFKKIEKLLDDGLDLELVSPTFGGGGFTLLHQACVIGSLRIVKSLVKRMKRTGTRNTKYISQPLFEAAKKGHLEIVKFLVQRGADINVKSKYYKPIFGAVKNGHFETFRYLIENGAELKGETRKRFLNQICDCKYIEKNRRRAFDGKIKIIEYCIKKKIISKKDKDLINYAAGFGTHHIVLLLLKKGWDINNKDRVYKQTPLIEAASRGRINNVKVLVKNGAKLEEKDKFGLTALLSSVYNDEMHTYIAKYLIRSGADIKAKSGRKSLLQLAIRSRHSCDQDYEFGEYLRRLKKDPKFKEERTDFEITYEADKAVQDDYLEGLKEMIKVGANIEEGIISPLLVSAGVYGSIKVSKYLLKIGAKIDGKGKYSKNTALIDAAACENWKLAEFLINQGADLNVYGFRENVLMKCLKNPKMVKLLIKRGVDLEAKTLTKKKYPKKFHENITALMLAIRRGYFESVKILINAGAKWDKKTIRFAKKEGTLEIYEYLKERLKND